MRANLVCFWPFSILNITKRTNRRPVIFIKENLYLLTNEMNEKLEWANQEFYLNFVIKNRCYGNIRPVCLFHIIFEIDFIPL